MIQLSFYPGRTALTLSDGEVKVSVFKGGEVNVTLSEKALLALKWARSSQSPAHMYITARITSSDMLMAFMLTVAAIREVYPSVKICATIAYFPYARQDRVCNPGEAHALKVAATMINSLNLERVTIFDPHSDVTKALLNNCTVISNHEFVLKAVAQINCTDLWVMAPDQGAYKKVFELAKSDSFAGFLFAIKDRDPKTMQIKDIQIQGDAKGKSILIVDDICDGGRTFLELGKALKSQGAEKIYLYVSHGIFSYGVESLSELFDGIYTTDSFHHISKVRDNPALTASNLHWLSTDF